MYVCFRKPVLVKGDGPMMKQRRWYAQFYSHGKVDSVDPEW